MLYSFYELDDVSSPKHKVYCGPHALSVISGKKVSEIYVLIKYVREGRKEGIRGMYNWEMTECLGFLSWRMKTCQWGSTYLLQDFAWKFKDTETSFLVFTDGHVTAYSEFYISDPSVDFPILAPFYISRYGNPSVRGWIEFERI